MPDLQEALHRTRTDDPFLTIEVTDPLVPSDHGENTVAGGGSDAPLTAPDVRTEFARFCDWLAGFIDGEGCFTIHGLRASWAPRFTLSARDDDDAILRQIVETTGIGSLYRIRASGTSKPQVVWQVERKSDCLALARLLDEHPLRARKARDYTIWREAVMRWHAHGPSAVEPYKAALEAIKVYGAVTPTEIPPDLHQQLGLGVAA